MMSFPFPRPLLALCLAGACTASLAAAAFAPVGAKATLSVEYLYESVGKKKNVDGGQREWRFKRSVSLVADLTSQASSELPTMQAPDAAQTAKLDKQAGQIKKIHTEMAPMMAPMMADIEKITDKCGEDEQCIEREIVKMGMAMAGTPEAEAMHKSGKEAIKALQPGVPRYQAWHATAQRGSYVIDETFHSVYVDPACQPTLLCTHNEVRKGSGALSSPSAASVEVDTAKNTLTVALPVPLLPLSYTETITTDLPERYHETPIPKGPQPNQLANQLSLRTSADGKPLTVALKGGWRSQSGEQVVQVKEGEEGGKLTVRWRFNVQ